MNVPKKIMQAAKEKADFLERAAGVRRGDLCICKVKKDFVLLNITGPGSESLITGRRFSDREVFQIVWGFAVIQGNTCKIV